MKLNIATVSPSWLIDGRIDALDSPAALKARYGAYTMDEVFRKVAVAKNTEKNKKTVSIFLSIIKKESLHLVRDPRTVLIVLCMPIILLLLFGFAISTEVNNVDVGIVTDSHSQEVRDIVSRIGSSPYFTLRGMMSQPEIEPAFAGRCRRCGPCAQGVIGKSRPSGRG